MPPSASSGRAATEAPMMAVAPGRGVGVSVDHRLLRSGAPFDGRSLAAFALGLAAGLSFFNAPLVTAAGVSVRPLDLGFVVAATLWILLRSGGVASSSSETRTPAMAEPSALRRTVLASAVGFGAIVLLSASWVALSDDGRVSALVSAARVIQTVVVGFLGWGIVHRERDLVATSWGVLSGALGLLVVNAVGVMLAPGVARALGVTLGPNGKAFIGPAAVMAIVASMLVRRGPVWGRVLLGAAGVVGLLSIASITAYLVLIVVVSAVTAFRAATDGTLLRIVSATLVSFVVTTSLSYLALTQVRPDALPSRDVAAQLAPSTEEVQLERPRAVQPDRAVPGATVLHRAVLAYTALKVFATEPVTGVGWTRGADPDIVGDPSIVSSAKDAFPDAWATLFTDMVPSGPHNAVLQALAELGLVGSVPLVVLFGASILLAARSISGRAGGRASEPRLFVFACALLSVGFLMTNGLFPGQPETVVWAWATGCAARRRRAAVPAAPRPR